VLTRVDGGGGEMRSRARGRRPQASNLAQGGDPKEAAGERVSAALTGGFQGGGAALFRPLGDEGNGVAKGQTAPWRGIL
jgi:hypothetical protein